MSKQIQEVLDTNTLPSEIATNLDAVRTIGNFAAHPIKSTSSGEIVNVELQEAELNLDVRRLARQRWGNKEIEEGGKGRIGLSKVKFQEELSNIMKKIFFGNSMVNTIENFLLIAPKAFNTI